jgi:membrane-associated protein
MEIEAIRALLQEQGLAVLFVLAVVEGPVATVVAGALAAAGLFDPLGVLAVALAGDLVGDGLLYALGRFCPQLARRMFPGRMPLQPAGLQAMFARRGGWLLLIGKLTHVAGFAVILTAGFARMAVGQFLLFSLAASLPKVAALAALGWVFGLSLGAGDLGLILVGVIATAGIAVLGLAMWRRRCA